jgi:hypothetical protein
MGRSGGLEREGGRQTIKGDGIVKLFIAYFQVLLKTHDPGVADVTSILFFCQ